MASTTLATQTEAADDGIRVRFSGVITEAADFSPVVKDAGTSNLILDLEGITRVNSSGVRLWILFIGELSKAARQLTLDRCSVAVVHQLNMVSNFKGKAAVASFYAPYVCESCGAEKSRLLDVPADAKKLSEPVPCPSCGAGMEFDDLPDAYLGFQQLK
jgi:hypothetical protein